MNILNSSLFVCYGAKEILKILSQVFEKTDISLCFHSIKNIFKTSVL